MFLHINQRFYNVAHAKKIVFLMGSGEKRSRSYFIEIWLSESGPEKIGNVSSGVFYSAYTEITKQSFGDNISLEEMENNSPL